MTPSLTEEIERFLSEQFNQEQRLEKFSAMSLSELLVERHYVREARRAWIERLGEAERVAKIDECIYALQWLEYDTHQLLLLERMIGAHEGRYGITVP